jgi:UV DNA damage endonuclease
MTQNIGYCCINTALRAQGITTNRGMIQRTFKERGLSYCSNLALQNVQDLLRIIEWNIANNITVFRMSSGMFPWGTEYTLADLPDFEAIRDTLKQAGQLARSAQMRLTFHPDHFVKLASEKPVVVQNSINELAHHAEVMDLLGMPENHTYCMNIHVGMKYSQPTVQRFNHIVTQYLPSNVTKRLVVENDDKESCFSVQQLVDDIHSVTNIPVTFDYFHHTFHPMHLSSANAAALAASTWNTTIPLFHYSESKNLNEGVNGNPRAHSDYAFTYIDQYDLTVDIDLECKAKEQAVLGYRQRYT